MTNATKALLITLINAGLVLIVSFGVTVSDGQQTAITGFVNAALAIWVALTYTNSAKRIS